MGSPANGFTAPQEIASADATDGIAIITDLVNTTSTTVNRIYVAYNSTASSQGLILKKLNSVLTVEDTETIHGTSTKIDGCSLLIKQDGDLQITYTLNATNTYDHKIRTAVYDPASNGSNLGSC